MRQLGVILTDKGSRYAVSGCPARSRAEIDAALKALKRDRSYAKATHNTWGALLSETGALKGDDGEAGAGMVILRMIERAGLTDHVVIVTRWFGGKHLGGDRFRHVQTCVREYLENI
jgi:putative IMPACT (imprinted ancient) family translation regulator